MVASPLEKRDYTKRLLVEGGEDKHFVISLMKKYVEWPDPPPLFIDDCKGIDQIIAPGRLVADLQASNVRTLGLIVDADNNWFDRYNQIKKLVSKVFPDMPLSLPKTGLIIDNPDNLRFGLWLMPDNSSSGTLENFIEPMIPSQQGKLWEIAAECVTNAIGVGAEVRKNHVLKSRLYTWLAWQNPPGYSPGNALTRNLLNPQSRSCQGFVHWFNELFEFLPLGS